jgi:CO/xanthine dehydrogenase FAD-binding subunit
MTTYVQANTVAEALAAMADGARPIAGGTDLVVGARQGKAPLPESLVGVHRIPGLESISEQGGTVSIGALVTHAALAGEPLIRGHYTALADGSAIVGSHATRVNGTIGGNVMNASPAMDTGAGLLCFDATATLAGLDGERIIGLDELWAGPGQTTAAGGELLTAIALHHRPGGSAYVRLQYRRQMEIAVVGVAAAVTFEGDSIVAARVAIAALTSVITRVPAAEAALMGTDGSAGAIDEAAAAVTQAARPISDVRASAEYRTAMARVIARRAIRTAVGRAGGEDVGIPASDTTFGS